MSIPEFSVTRRVTVLMLILIVTLFGVISFFNIGQDLFPDIEYPVLAVLTQYEGASSREIEKLVTKPLEEAASTLKDVTRVTSVSREGVSVITIEYNWGTNVDLAAEDARSQLGIIKALLPEDCQDPLVLKFDPTMMPVLMMGATGMNDRYGLRKYLTDVLAPRIEQVEGVAMVIVMGGEIREVQVVVDKEALDALAFTLSDVIRALRAENVDQSSGHVQVANREAMLKVSGEFVSAEEAGGVIVGWRNGRAVKVADVATVVPSGQKETRGRIRSNGEPAAFLAIMKQSGANAALTSVRVRKRLAALADTMPPGFELQELFDFGDVIRKIVKKTTGNAVTGALLAMLFMYLFLRNWRPTLAISLAIPLSLLTAFIGMYALDYTFNLMTLGGLALGVGMLVDNAVVVVENTYRHLERGRARIEAAVLGATEVDTAITASTFTTVAVFIPLVLVGGVAARMARPLAFTICLALGSSLFVAITLVPAIAASLFRAKSSEELAQEATRGRLFRAVLGHYRAMLEWLLDKGAYVVAAVTLLVAAAAFMGNQYLGGEFLPVADKPLLFLQLELPVGSTLDDTDRVVSVIEEYALAHKDELGIHTVMVNAGVFEEDRYAATQQGNPVDVNEAALYVRLAYREDRPLTSPEIQDILRRITPNLEPVPDAKTTFIDPMGQMTTTSQENAPIVLKLLGNDLEALTAAAEEVRRRVAGIKGIGDVKVNMRPGRPEQVIRLDRELAAQFGLPTGLAAQELRAALAGTVATRYRERGDEFDVRVRLEAGDRDALEKLLDLGITTPAGVTVPLRQIAHMATETAPQQIFRENRRRKVSILVNPGKDLDLRTAVAEIRKALADYQPELARRGAFLEISGQYEDWVDTVWAMLWAGIAAIILVYMVMAAQFESLYQPLVVMITVPLGFVGVVLGLGLTGRSVSLPAMLGFVILVGVVVNNAIVMIDYINLLRRRDRLDKRSAILEAAMTRLRPILITSLTTILGMLPMAMSQSQGSEYRSPMAIAVASGLAFAMLLTLFVIPVAYNYFDTWAERLVIYLKRVMYRE